ncbi:hypothetical protein QEH59_12930 [Coraliomargarita sp. SDUM461004]|uniref:PEP-CTERM protein-sorting domain-containing protein n=1 Tax=Thalassobacterium sedimentorum TaxID=3041258 RepID=A0ABU1AKY9_9BACT|nr:hypothetical protein [Coraliomargarita sp. SDUM461004]MDQ8195334.1 hypothetical protein [Coraliomargarita sp. SDUM461004]
MKLNPKYLRLIALTAISTLTAQVAHAETNLLNEDFSDGDRTTQNLPDSSTWYLRGNATSFDVSGNDLVLTSSEQTLNLVTYFTDVGAPYALQVGETLSVNMSVQLSEVNDTGIRFGVFNSNNSQITGSASNFQSSSFNGYDGYSAWFNPSASSDSYDLYERIGTSDAIFASSSSVNEQLGASNASTIGMFADTSANLMLSIERTVSGLTIVSSVNGYELTRSDADPDTFSFDTIAIQLSSSSLSNGETFSIENVSVSVIPEPSSFSFIMGASVLCLFLRRGVRR